MVLKLYFDPLSQPSRAVWLLIRSNRIACKEHLVSLREGDHLSGEYGRINPFRKVPAIDHDGFRLTESPAILKYLCHLHQLGYYPTANPALAAKIDEYMSWQHSNLRMNGSMYFLHAVILPMVKQVDVDTHRLQRFRRDLENSLDQIENIWLNNKNYVASDRITIADLLCISELQQPEMAGFDVRGGRPKLAAYMERVRGDLQPYFDEIHRCAITSREKLRDLGSKL